MDIETAISRAAGIQDKIASDVAPLGGFLRCETCRVTAPLGQARIGRYLTTGWPRCCGYTMRWWTQRQIDAGEVPA